MKKRTINFRLTEDTHKELQSIAKTCATTRTKVIEELVKAAYDRLAELQFDCTQFRKELGK